MCISQSPFLIFFSYQNLFFKKRGCQNLRNMCIIFLVFGREKMKLLKEMKDVLIASGILLSIMIGLLIFTQLYF